MKGFIMKRIVALSLMAFSLHAMEPAKVNEHTGINKDETFRVLCKDNICCILQEGTNFCVRTKKGVVPEPLRSCCHEKMTSELLSALKQQKDK